MYLLQQHGPLIDGALIESVNTDKDTAKSLAQRQQHKHNLVNTRQCLLIARRHSLRMQLGQQGGQRTARGGGLRRELTAHGCQKSSGCDIHGVAVSAAVDVGHSRILICDAAHEVVDDNGSFGGVAGPGQAVSPEDGTVGTALQPGVEDAIIGGTFACVFGEGGEGFLMPCLDV